MKPPGPQPHGRATLPFPHQLWACWGLGARRRDSAPRWSREPLGLRDGLGARLGTGRQSALSALERCVCVCMEVNALGPGEQRAESWLCAACRAAPHVCRSRVCLSVPVDLCTSCVRLTHQGVFLSLFLGLPPSHPHDASIILIVFIPLFLFCKSPVLEVLRKINGIFRACLPGC